jgi:hypothetical protein
MSAARGGRRPALRRHRHRYGHIGINVWVGAAFRLARAAWGAYPGHTYDDVQSGIGVVHNTLMFDKPAKTVVSAPFHPFPRSARYGQLALFPKPAAVATCSRHAWAQSLWQARQRWSALASSG